ncbi:MAG: polysaccharide deacetylase family protein [Acidobacteria bacterium]|nr:polysaccharide deacetylase family protein [Acidobacteriota bacterium]
MIGTRTACEFALAADGVATVAAAYAALSPGSQLFGSTIVAGSDPDEVAFTYDDGPNTAVTDEILDILARHRARATFFMIGRFVRQQPAIARRVLTAGHLIGNHTETHPWLCFQSMRMIREELRACNEALEDALGIPIGYLRPPHGARRPAVFHAAAELNLRIVQWNVMAYDWKPITPERILTNIDRGLRRARRRHVGSNILMHDGYDVAMGANRQSTLAATETLLTRFASERIRTVTPDVWA